jgi:hypothetical protein
MYKMQKRRFVGWNSRLERRGRKIYVLPSKSAKRAAEYARGSLGLSHRATRHEAFPFQAQSATS